MTMISGRCVSFRPRVCHEQTPQPVAKGWVTSPKETHRWSSELPKTIQSLSPLGWTIHSELGCSDCCVVKQYTHEPMGIGNLCRCLGLAHPRCWLSLLVIPDSCWLSPFCQPKNFPISIYIYIYMSKSSAACYPLTVVDQLSWSSTTLMVSINKESVSRKPAEYMRGPANQVRGPEVLTSRFTSRSTSHPHLQPMNL